MILEKHFTYDTNTGFYVINLPDVTSYIQTKMCHFQNFNNWMSKQEHIAFIQEIIDMYNEDVVVPDIDANPISHLLYFDKFDSRKFILYYDLVFILGTIVYNVFDYDKNAICYTENGQHGAINLSDMLICGYNELVVAKQTHMNAAYGSTLIFTTVLEAELKRKIKWLFIDDKVSEIKNQIQNNGLTLSNEDQILLDCLQGNRTDYNSVYATTIGADDLFDRLNIYDQQQKQEQKDLMLNKLTLNKLIQSSIIQSKAEPAFITIMKFLFGTGNLNLRNDIAHGGFGYQNYYHTAGAALLYYLVNMVVHDYWKL